MIIKKNILGGILSKFWWKLRYIKSPVEYAKHLGVEIGEGCKLVDSPNWGSEPYLITIKRNSYISYGVSFVTNDGGRWVLDHLYPEESPFYKFARITIGENVFIGCRVIIMPGVNIGNNVVVGAGSLVTKDIPEGEVWAGRPAKFLMSIGDYKSKMKGCELGVVFSDYWKNKRKELLRLLPQEEVGGNTF